jgi:putative DNA primase/helicase
MNVLDLLKRLPGIGVQTTTFDDPMRTSLLINFPNGTFDLEKGEFRGHRKTDFITSVLPANYNAEADCPLWVKFLGEVQEEDEEKLRFLWKAIGYSLTAATSEKCFFFCYGAGGDNGKSVFTEVLQHVLGSPEKGGYSLAARTESFMTKPSGADGVGDDIAAMRGSRAVFAPETKDGRAIDAQLMKLLTGGDTISARHLYGKPFNFVFGAKIWITGNHAPVVRDNGDAFWRRCRLIPWPVRISPERQDKGLSKKLVAEAEGILAWAIEGAKAWKTEGLGYPDSIRQAVQEYREDNDVLGKFLSECTMSRSGARTSPTELFERYESWCRHRNEKAMTMTAFGRRLAERNLTKSRRGDGRFYEDLDLVPEGETGGGPNPKPWAGLE